MTHEVELTLDDGTALDTWDEYVVTLSVTEPGAAFTFAMWYSETRRATWSVLRSRVKAMRSVELAIDGAPQLNGRIERIETSANGHGESAMVISGRDLAGPALDWDVDPSLNVGGLTLETALGRIFATVGIPVRVTTADAARELTTKRKGSTATEAAASSTPRGGLSESLRRALREAANLPWASGSTNAGVERVLVRRDETEPTIEGVAAITPPTRERRRARARAKAVKDIVIPIAHPRPGERVWSFAESIVSRIGARMWVAPDPERGLCVVVDTPESSGPAVFAFVRRIVNGVTDPRSNILSGTESISTREVPTTVVVYTGTDRGDKISSRGRTVVENGPLSTRETTRGMVADDPPPQPRHVRSTRARTIARASQEGTRIITDAMAGFRTYTVTVRGHSQSLDGTPRLYGINCIARVYDDVCTDPDGNALDEDMLITRVVFRRSRQGGTTTELTLLPLGALLSEPDV